MAKGYPIATGVIEPAATLSKIGWRSPALAGAFKEPKMSYYYLRASSDFEYREFHLRQECEPKHARK